MVFSYAAYNSSEADYLNFWHDVRAQGQISGAKVDFKDEKKKNKGKLLRE